MAEFEIGGKRYPIIDPDEWTWKEWRTAAEVTPNFHPSTVQNLLTTVDPEAWGAVILISMRRVDPRTPVGVLDNLAFMKTVVPLVTQWGEELEARAKERDDAEGDALPPEQPTPTADGPVSSGDVTPNSNTNDSKQNGPTSDEKESSPFSATTLDGVGSLPSSVSSE